MARISNEEIERLKREISVERLAEVRGMKLRRHGADLIGLCPFHDDREPSLVITPDKNLWHCLGACQAGGSVVDWVMRAEGVSFRLAIEILRKDGAASSTSSGKPAKHASTVKLPKLVSRDDSDEALLIRVVNFYHATLKESPEAIAYLESRGIKSVEVIEHFRIGYSNRTLGYRLPQKNRVEGEDIRGRLGKLGIYRQTGHEHFHGSLVIPIFDAQRERVVGMYGRKITPRLREGTPLHMYLPGPHRGVWNYEALANAPGGEVILCEALIDALTFWCAGYRNVTAAYGVEGFTEAHWAMLEETKTKVVRIAYDRDAAGNQAAEALSEKLNAKGIETYRVLFPKGMDANEYAKAVMPASQSLGLVLRKAEWMGRGARPVDVAHPDPIAIDETTVEKSNDVAVDEPKIETMVEKSTDVAITNVIEREDRIEVDEASVVVVERKKEVEPEIFPSLVALRSPPSHAEPGPASAVATPKPNPPVPHTASVERDEISFVFGDRQWRVRGLGKNLAFGQMRVNIGLSRSGVGFFVDTADLYVAKQRASYTRQAATELGVDEAILKRDLGEVLLGLEQRQEEQIEQALKPKANAVTMSAAEHEEATALLRDPRLLERVVADFETCGVVGEETNKLVGYLAAISRKLEEPLAVVIQSSSAAGKSSLMDAVLSFVPEEERVSYSAMTGQSLFYMGQDDLKHKVLAVVEEEGAERASYALKLLQSEGELTIASTGKDPITGKLITHTYKVSGPVGLFLTTTAITVDEELLNRCIVLTVDEGKEQTRAIHERQREAQTLEGLIAKVERKELRTLHQNAQRLLQPLLVVNPFARELSFADSRTRTRRDHMKYLTLIRTVALLHQHQREVKTTEHRGQILRYIEVAREDIAVAEKLASVVLGRGLDELPPQTRRLADLVDAMVTERARVQGVARAHVRFSRREVREHTSWGHTQVKVHMQRLEELEYVLVHRGVHGQGHVYELALSLASASSSTPPRTTQKWSGWSAPGRPPVGARSDTETDHFESDESASFRADPHSSTRVVGVDRDHVAGTKNGTASHVKNAVAR